MGRASARPIGRIPLECAPMSAGRRADPSTAAARAAGFRSSAACRSAPLPGARHTCARGSRTGRAGDMGYLERRAEIRLDPRRPVPDGRGASSASAFRIARPPRRPTTGGARCAGAWPPTPSGPTTTVTCARGSTASRRCWPRLFPGTRYLSYVDTGAILEREWARRAGLGWIAKNTLVLHRHAGSYFFLGELVSDLELDPVPLPRDHCGSCMRCVAACPTGALEQRLHDGSASLHRLSDDRASRRDPARACRAPIENWVFGCDVCQEVCPWNGDAHDDAAADRLTPSLPAATSRSTTPASTRASAAPPSRAPAAAASSATPPSPSATAATRTPSAARWRRSATPSRWCAATPRGRSADSGGARRAMRLERARRPRAACRRGSRASSTPASRRGRAPSDRYAERLSALGIDAERARASVVRTSHAAFTRSAGSAPSGTRPPAIMSCPPADLRAEHAAAGGRPRSCRGRWCGSSSRGSR